MNTILRLFYDLSVYSHILANSLWRSLGRFLFAYLILTAGLAVYLNARYVPDLMNQTTTILTTLKQTIPSDAIISMNNYQLTITHLNQPFVIDQYLYIDTAASTSSLASISATIAMNQTHLMLTGPDNTHEFHSYQDLNIADFSLTGGEIQSNVAWITDRLSQLKPYFPVILTVLMYPAVIIARLIHVLLYTLLFVLAASLLKSGYRFVDIFKITLHTIIVAETLNVAILIVYGTTYSSIFSVAFIGISILAYLNLPVRIQLPPEKID